MTEHFWLGMVVVFVSGAFNGGFTFPMKLTRTWRWENLWLAFSLLSTLILPWSLTVAFVPGLSHIYQGVPGRILLYPLLFGFLWGMAQVTLGLGVKALGMAFAIAVISGLSCLSGSLIPLLVLNPADLLRPRGVLLLISMPILFVGLYFTAKAGRQREREQQALDAAPVPGAGSFLKGLVMCILTGVLGSSLNLGLAFSGDIIRKSAELGASPLTSTYAVWALVLTGGFTPALVYCSFLLSRNRSWSLFRQGSWRRDSMLGMAMALIWVTAIFSYGIGATLVGRYGTSLGYALLNALTILSSTVLGILTGEWKATSRETRKSLAFGIAGLLVSVIVINLGGLF